jgi:two-component system response regulator FixJ
MTVTHAGPTTRTLYLLDDNADFRTTARWWLEGAGYRVLDFADANAAIATLEHQMQAGTLADSCLLLDVRMPGMSGLQVHDALIARGIAGPGAQWPLPVVYMTGHGDVPLAVQAMEKGAITFLEKPFEDSALEQALAKAFEAPAAPHRPPACAEFQRRLATLTDRESEVMRGVVDGKMSKEIARDLNISAKTVELHRGRVLGKMQADSAVHLTRMTMAQRVL